jgi:histone deacetylase 11
MLRGVKGTIVGAWKAMENSWAINLAGGQHHASKNKGEGFCIYPDISLAIHFLRKMYKNRAE